MYNRSTLKSQKDYRNRTDRMQSFDDWFSINVTSSLQIIIFHLIQVCYSTIRLYPHISNSTHHPSRSPISSLFHLLRLSYLLHFVQSSLPSYMPFVLSIGNSNKNFCSCTSSPFVSDNRLSTLICFNNSSADDCFTSAYRHVLFLLELFHPIERLSVHNELDVIPHHQYPRYIE